MLALPPTDRTDQPPPLSHPADLGPDRASLLRRLARGLRRVVLPGARAIARLEREHADRLLQPSPFTRFDRHPALFAFVRERLAERSEPHLLSYGCSTGEEPITLARYFPQARIDAVDINPRSLAIARRRAARAGCPGIAFQLSGEPPSGPACYDAVFCLSVLRHGDLDAHRPASSAALFPFARFEEVVAGLDRRLKPGGLLVIWGSNYRLTDSALAHRYRSLAVPGIRPQGGAFYGSDERRIDEAGWTRFVFEKLGE